MIFKLFTRKTKKHKWKLRWESSILHIDKTIELMQYLKSIGFDAYILGTDY